MYHVCMYRERERERRKGQFVIQKLFCVCVSLLRLFLWFLLCSIHSNDSGFSLHLFAIVVVRYPPLLLCGLSSNFRGESIIRSLSSDRPWISQSFTSLLDLHRPGFDLKRPCVSDREGSSTYSFDRSKISLYIFIFPCLSIGIFVFFSFHFVLHASWELGNPEEKTNSGRLSLFLDYSLSNLQVIAKLLVLFPLLYTHTHTHTHTHMYVCVFCLRIMSCMYPCVYVFDIFMYIDVTM